MGKVVLRLENTVRRRLVAKKRNEGGKYRDIIEEAIDRHHGRLMEAEDKSVFIAELAAERRYAEKLPYASAQKTLGTELTETGHEKLRFCAMVQGISESLVVNQALISFLRIGPWTPDAVDSLEEWIGFNSPLTTTRQLQAFLASRGDED